jgi:outer membrane receptor protein involved in Fe transport
MSEPFFFIEIVIDNYSWRRSMKHLKKTAIAAGVGLLAFGCAAYAQEAPANTANAVKKASRSDAEDAAKAAVVVVTGVLRDTSAEKAAISVSTVDEERMRAVAPVSPADLLTEIPGVVVTSDAGEARNTVSTRGISNGTSAGTVGYYWNALMEDGLPVIGGLFSNFSPDMFLRVDATTKSVQAVRGGSAAVTGPNAPAGLFNYLSKNGLTDPGGLIGVRLGVENTDHPGNLYQKYDFYFGSRNEDRTLGWSIGGDYRRSYGYRDIPDPPNRGGQLKGNVSKRYNSGWGSGTVTVSAKLLDDHVGFLDIVRPMAHGWDPVQFDTPFGRSANFLPSGDLAHAIRSGVDGRTDWWDPQEYAHSKTHALGLKLDHDFGNGWKIANNMRYQSNQIHHSEAEGIGYQSATNGANYTGIGTALAGLSTTPGYFTIKDRVTGQVVVRVNQRTAASAATGAACSGTCIQSTTPNLLPNSSIQANSPIGSNNLMVTVSALNNKIRSDDMLNLFTANKTLDFGDNGKLTVTGGAYLAWIHFTRDSLNGGHGLMGLQNNPTTYDVSFTTQAASPVTYQLTNPNGFGSIGSTAGSSVGTVMENVHTREVSPLLGLTYEKDKLLLDFGARFTSYSFSGTNNRYVTNPGAASRSFGGFDGNPLTIYDNLYAVSSSTSAINFDKRIHYVQYTGAVNYILGPRSGIHARYTYGQKNGDGFWNAYDEQWKVAALNPDIRPIVKQAEIGYRYATRGFSIEATPYYVDLDKVGVTSYGRLADGVTQYVRPPIYSHFNSYGIELDNKLRLLSWLGLHNVLTLNKSKALSAASWASGCGGTLQACPAGVDPRPDVAVYASGPQERSNHVTYNGTLNADFDDFGGYLRFRFIGKRPTSTAATSYLPANKLADMGLYYNVTDKIRLDFNVNNLLNNRNATQIGQLGSLPAGMTQDQFIAQYPNALVTVQTNAPRTFFLSANMRF